MDIEGRDNNSGGDGSEQQRRAVMRAPGCDAEGTDEVVVETMIQVSAGGKI